MPKYGLRVSNAQGFTTRSPGPLREDLLTRLMSITLFLYRQTKQFLLHPSVKIKDKKQNW